MSYCRFSSDDFQCDVYCYESVGDVFIIHVAGNRVIFKESLPEPVKLIEDSKLWLERYNKVSKMVSEANREPIGLEFDGQTFSAQSYEECLSILIKLRGLGYRIPHYVFQALKEEQESISDSEE